LYQDIRRQQPLIPGLSITQVWLRGPLGSVSQPAVLTGPDSFQHALEGDPGVGAAIGVTTILLMFRYVGGAGDRWPDDPEAVEQLAGDLEGLMAREPMLQGFVRPTPPARTQKTV